MGRTLGRLFVPGLAVFGALLLLGGVADRRDAQMIAGSILLGSAAIAGSRRAGV